ncbi:protein phosphatase 2C family protein [Candidatus Woesearchaeota archaeon]|nr:protein phosphatase 2C family protein [Candidatus Woesearchaeota archaeon]
MVFYASYENSGISYSINIGNGFNMHVAAVTNKGKRKFNCDGYVLSDRFFAVCDGIADSALAVRTTLDFLALAYSSMNDKLELGNKLLKYLVSFGCDQQQLSKIFDFMNDLGSHVHSSSDIRDVALKAHEAILCLDQKVGTTLVSGYFGNRDFSFYHQGDSSLIYFDDSGSVCELTKQDTITADLDLAVLRGDVSRSRNSYGNGCLSACIGNSGPNFKRKVTSFRLVPGNYLFYTNGIYFDCNYTADVIKKSYRDGSAWLDRMNHGLFRLTENVLRGGGEDNMTAVLVRIEKS